MSALELVDVSRTYPGAARPAVEAVSLTCPPGAVTVLVGPSGCGKSTLLGLVAGDAEPDAGDIRLGGRSIAGLAPERRGVVLMGQNPLLFPHMNVLDNVAFGLAMRGIDLEERRRRAERMLERVHLPGYGPRAPRALSGGQAQRVALARALVIEPDGLLLDEPLTSLDPELRREMQDLVRRLVAETGTTTLFVSHDREEAVALADHMALMLEGRLIQAGPPGDLFERPRTVEAARFFGIANLIEADFKGRSAQTALGPLALAAPARGRGVIAVRPESIRLHMENTAIRREAKSDAAPLWPARVVAARYRGTHTVLDLDAGALRLVVHVIGPAPGEGASVRVEIPAEAAWPISG